MHRFYLSPAECQTDPLTLSERESHHAISVLRIRPRERVVVLNGAGEEFLCEARESDRRALTLKVVRKNRIPPLPYQVTLAQAVTKGKTMELIVQKAVEIGAGAYPGVDHCPVDDLLASERKAGFVMLAAVTVIVPPSAALIAAPSASETPKNGISTSAAAPVSGFEMILPSNGGNAFALLTIRTAAAP